MKTPVRLLITAIAAVLLVAACSTNGVPATTTADTTSSTVPPPAPTPTTQAPREPTPEELIAEYDAVISRWGDSADPAKVSQVATAFLAKGAALEKLGRADGAVTQYDEVTTRWANTADPGRRPKSPLHTWPKAPC